MLESEEDMLISTKKFHNCNAHVDVYDEPCPHEVFTSYKKTICIISSTRENDRDVLLVWALPYATRISSTTTRQLCRYLGEHISKYLTISTTKSGTLSQRNGYMSVNHVRMLIATGMLSDDDGVYVRYMGSLSAYTPDALRTAYYA